MSGADLFSAARDGRVEEVQRLLAQNAANELKEVWLAGCLQACSLLLRTRVKHLYFWIEAPG